MKVRGYCKGFVFLFCALLVLAFVPDALLAGSATWNANPGNGDWNTAGNWSAGGPPNGAGDTATFGASSITGVSLSDFTTVDGITFTAAAGANPFTIAVSSTLSLTIDGAGIVNNSGVTQNFTTAGDGFNRGFIVFNGSANASDPTGSPTMFTNNRGVTEFINSANARNGIFINSGSPDTGSASETDFTNSSHAGTGSFTSNGGTASGGFGGFTSFIGVSHGDTATFTSNGATVNGANGGVTNFGGGSFADAATLIANGGSNGGGGGTITFSSGGTGGTARVEVFGNGNLDIGLNNVGSGVTIGSLEGTGNVFLSNRNLTVGSNNMTTSFSGVIQDGGQGGFTGGSLTKIGGGTLSLTNANTFTGGTLINAGTLIAAHDGALGTGNVSLTASGVTLTLQSGATNNYISNNASISIVTGATANLNFTGTSDIVGSIVLNGVTQTTPGTYGSSSSGATFQSAFFSGTGTLTLVPEPSTAALIGAGSAALLVMQRLRRRRR